MASVVLQTSDGRSMRMEFSDLLKLIINEINYSRLALDDFFEGRNNASKHADVIADTMADRIEKKLAEKT